MTDEHPTQSLPIREKPAMPQPTIQPSDDADSCHDLLGSNADDSIETIRRVLDGLRAA